MQTHSCTHPTNCTNTHAQWKKRPSDALSAVVFSWVCVSLYLAALSPRCCSFSVCLSAEENIWSSTAKSLWAGMQGDSSGSYSSMDFKWSLTHDGEQMLARLHATWAKPRLNCHFLFASTQTLQVWVFASLHLILTQIPWLLGDLQGHECCLSFGCLLWG